MARQRVSRTTVATRWIGASAGLLLVAAFQVRYGHGPALALMLILLVGVAVLGGSSKSET